MKIVFYPIPSLKNRYYLLLKKVAYDRGYEIIEPKSLSWFLKNKNGVDVVHINWLSRIKKNFFKSFFFLSVLFLLNIYGKKIIWTEHNIHPHESKRKLGSKLFNFLLMLICSKIVIQDYKRFKKLKDKRKYCYIHHPTFESIFHVIPDTKTQIQGNKISFLYFGYIRKYKGIDLLIDIASKFRDSDFMVIGDPSFFWKKEKEKRNLLHSIRKAAKRNNFSALLKYVPDSEIPEILTGYDILVLPYHKFHISGMLMLSFTFNLPCVIKSNSFSDFFAEKGMAITFNTKEELSTIIKNITKQDIAILKNNIMTQKHLFSFSSFKEIQQSIYET